MAEDINTLVLKVTSDGIADATNKLDAMEGSAKQAENAATSLANASTKASTAASGVATAMDAAASSTKKGTDVILQANAALAENALSYSRAQAEALRMNQALDAMNGTVDKGTVAVHGQAAMIREGLVMAHEAAMGSYKRLAGSATVFLNASGALPAVMEAITGSFAAAAEAGGLFVAGLAVITAAVVGVVAALAAVVAGFALGAEEQHKFTDALVLNGNRMGVTMDDIDNSAKQIASSTNTSINSTKSVLMAMAESGTVSRANMDVAALAMTNYKELSGATAEQAVQHFAGMKDGVYNFALEMGKTGVVFSSESMQMIKHLEETGHSVEAQRIFFQQYNNDINQSSRELSMLGQAMHDVAVTFGNAWAAIKNIGYKDTMQDQLDAINNQRKNMAHGMAETASETQYWNDQIAAIHKKFADKELAVQKAADDATAQQRKNTNDKWLEDQEAHYRTDEQQHIKRIEEIKAHGDDTVISQKRVHDLIDAENARWEKANRPKAGSDDSSARRQEAINNAKLVAEDAIYESDRAYAEAKKNSDKTIDDQLDLIKAIQDHTAQRLQAQKTYYAAVQDADNQYKAVHNANRKQIGDADNKIAADELANRKAVDAITAQGDDAQMTAMKTISDLNDKAIKDIQDKANAEDKTIKSTLDGVNRQIAAINGNKEASTELMAVQREAHLQEMKDTLEKNDLLALTMLATGTLNDSQVQAAQDAHDAAVKAIQDQQNLIVATNELADAQAKAQAALNVTKALDEDLAAAKRFEKAMTDAFGNIGKSIGGVLTAIAQMGKDQDTNQQKYLRAQKEIAASNEDVMVKAMMMDKARADFQQNQAITEINSYGNIAQAAQGMFDSNSKGYAAMGAASKIFHIAEVAMNLVRMTQSGILAVLNQGSGDPYSAFARMAAMAAIVTGLGVAINSAGGGNGGAATAQQNQQTQGTGTVLGDMSAKSNTIADELKVISSNSNEMLPLTSLMQQSLANIENSIGGLASMVAQQIPGLISGNTMNIQQGVSYAGNARNQGSQVIGTTGAIFGGAIGEDIGKAVGGLVGSLTGKINSLLGPVGNALNNLWGKTSQSIVDSGLQFSGAVSALIRGQGFQQYANVNTTTSSWFGLSKSTSSSTQTQGLSADISAQFGLIFKNLETTLAAAAPALGKSAQGVTDAINNMVLQTQTISLKGLSGQALTTAINNVISGAMDTIASTALPGFAQFQKVGEGYAQTVIRVATDTESADTALKALGVSAISYNDIADKTGDVAAQIVQQSIALKEAGSGVGQIISGLTASAADLVKEYQALTDARQKMQAVGLGGNLNQDTINGAGGLSNLTTDLQTYYSKFFTQAEQNQMETKRLSDAFAQLGVTMPASDNALKLMIETASNAGNQKLVGGLLSLAGGFDTLMTNIQNTANAVNNAAQSFAASNAAFSALQASVTAQTNADNAKYTQDMNDAAANHQKILDGIAAEQTAKQAANDAQVAAAKVAAAAAVSAYQAQEQAVQASITALNSQISTINSIISATTAATQAISTESLADEHRRALAEVQAAAASGSVTSDPNLLNAIKSLQKPTETLYSSLADYNYAQGVSAAALNDLKNKGTTQLTDAQQQVVALQNLDTSLKNASTAATQSVNDLKTNLDNTLSANIKTETDSENARYSAEQADLTAKHNDDLAKLQAILDNATKQLDALEGINTSVLSVASALAGFTAAIQSDAAANAAAQALAKANANATTGTTTTGATTATDNTIYPNGGARPKSNPGSNVKPVAVTDPVAKAAANKAAAVQQTSQDNLNGKMDQLIQTIQIGDVANVQKTNEMYRYIRNWNSEGMPPVRPNL